MIPLMYVQAVAHGVPRHHNHRKRFMLKLPDCEFQNRFRSRVNLLALSFCGMSGILWMLLAAKRYYYYIFDTGWHSALFAQNLWGILHGDFAPTVLGANFLTDHCSFIAFLIAPLYALFPDPVFLQYLKITAFFSGAYIFFLILNKRLHPLIALLAMIAFSIAPANVSMLSHVFAYEPFCIPLFFLIFKALDDDNYFVYITGCILLLLIKEQMPLIVLMFGVFAFFFKKNDKIKWALIPVILGIAVFIFDVFVLTPYVRKGLEMQQSFFWSRYAPLGKTPLHILRMLTLHPSLIFLKSFSSQNSGWYTGLFGWWGWLALLSPHVLFVALPLFLKSLLSFNVWENNDIHAYYAATFTPFIFLAVWNSLTYLKQKWVCLLQIAALAFMFYHASTFWDRWRHGKT